MCEIKRHVGEGSSAHNHSTVWGWGSGGSTCAQWRDDLGSVAGRPVLSGGRGPRWPAGIQAVVDLLFLFPYKTLNCFLVSRAFIEVFHFSSHMFNLSGLTLTPCSFFILSCSCFKGEEDVRRCTLFSAHSCSPYYLISPECLHECIFVVTLSLLQFLVLHTKSLHFKSWIMGLKRQLRG